MRGLRHFAAVFLSVPVRQMTFNKTINWAAEEMSLVFRLEIFVVNENCSV